MLHRLIYFSRQNFPADADVDQEVATIIRTSIPNNRQVDVTGLLLVHQGWFVQVLEGSYEAVQTVYGRIVPDVRHKNPTVISAGSAEHRLFGDWNMCARRMNDADGAILDVLDRRGAFAPASLSPPAALRLLSTVAQIQGGGGR